MNKLALLDAARAWCNKETLHLANQVLTDEKVDTLFTKLDRRLTFINKEFYRFLIASSLLIFGFISINVFGGEFLSKTAQPANIYQKCAVALAGTIMVSGCLAIAANIVRDIGVGVWGGETRHQLLQPLSGDSRCKQALEALESGGPLVTEWRDFALTERNQLLILDLQIMRALAYRHMREKAAAAEKNSLEQICRKVHGLATESVEPVKA